MPATRPQEMGTPRAAEPGVLLPLERDHLFISYAWEDGALAEWLVRKLTAAGYRVWCDRFKMLGGERWPKDIDRAIKTRTFRMLALISRHSLDKPNPVKERQLALALSRERSEEFLIPLNMDGRSATEIGWELSDISWVPFERWSTGLQQLLAKLGKIGAPRPLGDAGPAVAATTFLPADVLGTDPEPLYSNCLVVEQVPDNIHHFNLSRHLAPFEAAALEALWAYVPFGTTGALSFTAPPDGALETCAPECTVTRQASYRWRDAPRIYEMPSQHVITTLLKRSLMVRSVECGMQRTPDGNTAFFPEGLLPKNKLAFRSYSGRRTSISVLGERRFGRGRTRYQVGVAFWVRFDIFDTPVVVLKIRLHMTDPGGGTLSGIAVNARRKKVAKSWWNHEWLSRQLAIAEFLRGSADAIVIGTTLNEQVRINPGVVTQLVTPSINDAALEPLRRKIDAMNAASAEEDRDAPDNGAVSDA